MSQSLFDQLTSRFPGCSVMLAIAPAEHVNGEDRPAMFRIDLQWEVTENGFPLTDENGRARLGTCICNGPLGEADHLLATMADKLPKLKQEAIDLHKRGEVNILREIPTTSMDDIPPGRTH